MLLPSKELLSEVLQKEVVKVKEIENTTLIYGCAVHDGWYYEINIYEFAHKCKEWAYTNHEAVINIFQKTRYNPYTAKLEGKVFQSDTEPEAIFKACEWIMEQKQND